jgi:hypothetical protein
VTGWSALFALTNVVAMAGWAWLAFGPRGDTARAFVLHGGVGLLCVVYVLLFAGLFGGFLDPARVPGSAEPDLADYSISGLRALFMSDGGLVLGWTHYLALDLFTGQWIARDADRKGWSRSAQVPVLFLTLMAGPLGLLVWLALRRLRPGRAAAKAR